MRLIIDKAVRRANILSLIFRRGKLLMCKCSFDCFHKKFRANCRALKRISERYVFPCDETTKLRRFKLLRGLYSRHEIFEVVMALDWISENGLPGDRNVRCIDPIQWAASNDLSFVLTKARELEKVREKFSKAPAVTAEEVTEETAASSEARRLLSMLVKEYRTEEERRQKIAAEVAQIRIELNEPDLRETDQILSYAIARICLRIELGSPLLENRLAG